MHIFLWDGKNMQYVLALSHCNAWFNIGFPHMFYILTENWINITYGIGLMALTLRCWSNDRLQVLECMLTKLKLTHFILLHILSPSYSQLLMEQITKLFSAIDVYSFLWIKSFNYNNQIGKKKFFCT